MRILISIPDDLLAEVDKACSKEERPRSQLIRLAIRHYLKAEDLIMSTISKATAPPPSNKCDMEFCKSPAVGMFRISIPDNIEGSISSEKNLCQFHLHQAKREGGATEI